NATTGGTYNGWDRMFRGKFDTAIREFQNVFYQTAMASCPSFTNQHQLLVRGSVEPTDSLTVEALYGHFWLDEPWSENGGIAPENKKINVGDEFDLQLTWDYTEDVQFGLLAAWFFPGDHFIGGQDDTATDVVTSVKLSF
ncbi:MAG: alginate export family protein, partial [Candidatus Omnitrophota bacterium]